MNYLQIFNFRIESFSMSNINPQLDFQASKFSDYPIIVPTEKWIRIYIGETLIAESYAPLLLLDNNGRELVYFFKKSEVQMQYFSDSDYKGKQEMFQYWHIKVQNKKIENGAFSYNESTQGEYKKLIGYIAFKWNAITKITEEDVELIGHPRNPFHRIDTRPTSRLIQLKIKDYIIAESTHSIALFETNLRVRYYIPIEDIKMELLEKTTTTTICPYKGVASYWNVNLDGETHKDIAWSYLEPMQDANLIKGLISFWGIDLYVNNEFIGNY